MVFSDILGGTVTYLEALDSPIIAAPGFPRTLGGYPQAPMAPAPPREFMTTSCHCTHIFCQGTGLGWLAGEAFPGGTSPLFSYFL